MVEHDFGGVFRRKVVRIAAPFFCYTFFSIHLQFYMLKKVSFMHITHNAHTFLIMYLHSNSLSKNMWRLAYNTRIIKMVPDQRNLKNHCFFSNANLTHFPSRVFFQEWKADPILKVSSSLEKLSVNSFGASFLSAWHPIPFQGFLLFASFYHLNGYNPWLHVRFLLKYIMLKVHWAANIFSTNSNFHLLVDFDSAIPCFTQSSVWFTGVLVLSCSVWPLLI